MSNDLDVTTLHPAVVGGGLRLTRPGGRMVLHTLDQGPTLLGDFTDVRDAWVAIDAFDLREAGASSTAAAA